MKYEASVVEIPDKWISVALTKTENWRNVHRIPRLEAPTWSISTLLMALGKSRRGPPRAGWAVSRCDCLPLATTGPRTTKDKALT